MFQVMYQQRSKSSLLDIDKSHGQSLYIEPHTFTTVAEKATKESAQKPMMMEPIKTESPIKPIKTQPQNQLGLERFENNRIGIQPTKIPTRSPLQSSALFKKQEQTITTISKCLFPQTDKIFETTKTQLLSNGQSNLLDLNSILSDCRNPMLLAHLQNSPLMSEPEPAKVIPTPTLDHILPDIESFEVDSEAASKIDLAVRQLNQNLNILQDEVHTPSSQSLNRSSNSSVLSQRRHQHYIAKQQKTVETLSAIIDMLQSLKEKKLLDVRN